MSKAPGDGVQRREQTLAKLGELIHPDESDALATALAEIGGDPILASGVVTRVRFSLATYLLVTPRGVYYGGSGRLVRRGLLRRAQKGSGMKSGFLAAESVGVLRFLEDGDGPVFTMFAGDETADSVYLTLFVRGFPLSPRDTVRAIGDALGARLLAL
jgi:hypothetical protein